MPDRVIKFVEQAFFTMLWIVAILIAFVALSSYLQNNNVPVLSNVFSWAQSHAGLQQ